MTTTRALAVAAYLAATAAPAAADWRSIADQLHAALPATRGAMKPADAPSGSVPRWFADWKLGKVYSLDSLAVTFSDGTSVRVNLAKAPGKAPRIAAACRVAIAFYRASTGRDTVPAFASLVAASDGETFDAAACSALTDGLRRTAYVAPAVRPAVTAEAIARMERELERRRAGLATAEAMPARIAAFHIPLCLSWDAYTARHVELRRMKDAAALAESWRRAIEAGEAELSAMQLAAMRARVAEPDAPAPAAAPAEAATVAAEPLPAPCEPVAAVPAAEAAPEPVAVPVVVAAEPEPVRPAPALAAPVAEPSNDDAPVPPMPGAPAPAVPDIAAAPADPVEGMSGRSPVEAICADAAHLEPLAICPAVGMPCKPDCGFRSTCALPGTAEAIEAVEAEPLAPLSSDDDVPAAPMPGPVTVLCLSHKAREAVLSRTGGRAVPDYSTGAKGGAFRLSLDDAATCAGLRSVRFVGLPRKAYTRAAPVRPPVEAIAAPAQSAPFLAGLATSLRRGYAACYAASSI